MELFVHPPPPQPLLRQGNSENEKSLLILTFFSINLPEFYQILLKSTVFVLFSGDFSK